MINRLAWMLIPLLLITGCKTPTQRKIEKRQAKRAALPPPPLPPGLVESAAANDITFTSVTRTNLNLYLRWTGPVGSVYQLQSKTNVTQTLWQNVGSESTNTSAVVPINKPFTFYRVASAAQTTPGQMFWLKTSTGGSAVATGIKADSAGNVVVVGHFSGTVDFGGGNVTSPAVGSLWSIFIVKYNSQGGFIWQKVFGNTDYASAQGVVIDSSDNVIVSGYFAQSLNFGGGVLSSVGAYDVFTVKYTPAGSHVWSKRFGGFGTDGLIAVGTAVDSGGNIGLAVPLGFTTTADFGGIIVTNKGSSDLVVCKLNSAGTVLWAKLYGSDQSEIAHSLAIDSLGDFVVTGELQGQSTDLGGGVRTSPATINIFIAKYSGANGAHTWSKLFGQTSNNYGYGIASDSSTRNSVVTGHFSGTINFGGSILDTGGNGGIFLLGLDPSGNHLWSKATGSGDDKGLAVEIRNGHLVVSGKALSINFGQWPEFQTLLGSGYFVANLNISGNAMPTARWQQVATGGGGAQGNAIAFDSTHVLTAGSFLGVTDFGDFSATANALQPSMFTLQYQD